MPYIHPLVTQEQVKTRFFKSPGFGLVLSAAFFLLGGAKVAQAQGQTPPAALKSAAAVPGVDDPPELPLIRGKAAGQDFIPAPLDTAVNGIHLNNASLVWEFEDGLNLHFAGAKPGLEAGATASAAIDATTNATIDAETIVLMISQIDESLLASKLPRSETKKTKVDVISWSWPETVLSEGTLKVISEDGAVLYSEDIDRAKVAAWRALQRRIPILQKQHEGSIYGMVATEGLPLLKDKQRLHFCVQKKDLHSSFTAEICSPSMRISTTRGFAHVVVPVRDVPVHLKVDGVDQKADGAVATMAGKSIDIAAYFSTGATVRITTVVPAVPLTDLSLNERTQTIRLEGRGRTPLGGGTKLTFLNEEAKSKVPEAERVWRLEVSNRKPQLIYPGPGGVAFIYSLTAAELPSDRARSMIQAPPTGATYLARPLIRGELATTTATVSSSEYKAMKVNDSDFIWEFAAPNLGQMNRASFDVEDLKHPGKKWRAHYEIYRAHANDAGFFFNESFASAKGPGFNGEYTHSFEDAPTFDFIPHHWRYQRFSAMAQGFAVGSTTTNQGSLQGVLDLGADLRYALSPGIWDRDFLYGVLAGAAITRFGSTEMNLLGYGAYLGTPLPRGSDGWIVPSRKYVDLKFSFYPIALGSSPSMASEDLAVRLKMFWRQSLYGQLGLAWRDYAFVNGSQQSTWQTFSVLVGLGWLL